MKRAASIWYWLPRVIGIVAILLVSMFALDAFQPGLPLWRQVVAFLIHMVPSFVLAAILILAWKRELTGGLVFLFIGLAFSPIIFLHNYHMNQSVGMSLSVILFITFPFVLVGILFIWNYFSGRTNRNRHLV